MEDLDATLLFFEDIFLEAGAGGASSTLTDLERGWGSGCWGCCSEAAEDTESSSVLETLLETQASLFEDSSSESSSISRGPSPSSEDELEPVDEVDS